MEFGICAGYGVARAGQGIKLKLKPVTLSPMVADTSRQERLLAASRGPGIRPVQE